MKTSRSFLVALVFACVTTAALAAGIYTNGIPQAGGTAFPSTIPLTGLELAPLDTQIPQGAAPQSESVSVAQLLQGSTSSATNATSFTGTAAQFVNGEQTRLLLTGAPSTAQTLTTPTAVAVIAALPAGSAVGYSWLVKIVNVGGTASGVWTVAGGAGVTVSGNATVAVAGSRTYLATETAATTVTLQDWGQ